MLLPAVKLKTYFPLDALVYHSAQQNAGPLFLRPTALDQIHLGVAAIACLGRGLCKEKNKASNRVGEGRHNCLFRQLSGTQLLLVFSLGYHEKHLEG